MSFLIVGSEKGTFNENELLSHLTMCGVQNPQEVISETIKRRKYIVGDQKILSLQ
jgi:hypothetical protein